MWGQAGIQPPTADADRNESLVTLPSVTYVASATLVLYCSGASACCNAALLLVTMLVNGLGVWSDAMVGRLEVY